MEYLHSSFAGTYWIECDLIATMSNNKFKISYFDSFLNQQEERIVDRSDVRGITDREYQLPDKSTIVIPMEWDPELNEWLMTPEGLRQVFDNKIKE